MEYEMALMLIFYVWLGQKILNYASQVAQLASLA
jgi:type III secretory pathway component EscS